MYIDYHTLKRRTIPNQYTMPWVNDDLDSLNGSCRFSVLDLRSEYYQVPMAQKDPEKTAFICPLGFYQFNCMPQGVSGAPARFQRPLEWVIADIHLLKCLLYLDDIVVFERTLKNHEIQLCKFLDHLQEAGLKLSLDKCIFCQTSTRYVDHIVSAGGITTDPERVKVLTTSPRPTSLKELQSYLGFYSYQHRFIKNFSHIMHALTEFTNG
ncbi:unnamed protein product [Eretmochelys imbricata]